MCCSYSAVYCLTVATTGLVAKSPRAHRTLPLIWVLSESSRSRAPGTPRPASIRVRTLNRHEGPSRHGVALATGVVAEDLSHRRGAAHEARGVVEQDQRRGAHHRAGRLHRVIVERGMELVASEDRRRHTRRQHTFHGPAVDHAAAVAVN